MIQDTVAIVQALTKKFVYHPCFVLPTIEQLHVAATLAVVRDSLASCCFAVRKRQQNGIIGISGGLQAAVLERKEHAQLR